MPNKINRWLKTLNYPSYIIFFVTARCNAQCKMCFYKENMDASSKTNELRLEEYEKIARHIKVINILGISGGEPFLRQDLSEIIHILYAHCSPILVDLPTNGYFTNSVLQQVEETARKCPNMIIDVQVSIDGPELIHNEIRGLKDGFSHMQQTYLGLVKLKKVYKNLRLKACVVYSHYNQDHIEELFSILEKDFKDFDRIVFSVVHGSVSNQEALAFDWERYFSLCEKIRRSATIKQITDFHSLFTVALRIVKNDFLKKLLREKDMYKVCGAGSKVVVINETGKVFPCEPLWKPVGDLRSNNYNLEAILSSDEMQAYWKEMKTNKCTCHWGLPMSNAILYKTEYYPKLFSEMSKIMLRSIFKKKCL